MQIFKKKIVCFLLHLRMKIVLTELYIILVYEKIYFFIYLITHGSKSSFV